MPNGYLLYNFAATFLVDLTFQQTKRFYMWHILLINLIYLVLILFTSKGVVDLDFNSQFIPNNSILSQTFILNRIAISIGVSGILSFCFALLHWKKTIYFLYENEENNQEVLMLEENPKQCG